MFTVTLHQLSPDLKKTGAAFPDTELAGVSEKKLRVLLRTLAERALEDNGAASPELRVVAPHGQFVVQISGGRLRINSWTLRVGGADLTPDQIYTLIAGTAAVANATEEARAGVGQRSRRGWLALFAILIVASNATTAWLLLRKPANPFLPEYTVLDQEPGVRFLALVSGEYQSGTHEGARLLAIAGSGRAHWKTLGPNGAAVEESDVNIQPVQSRGRQALLADERALIEFPDPVSLVFYNETYRRKVP